MLKRIVFGGLAGVAIGAHARDVSNGVDLSRYADEPVPYGSLVPNDLTLDPAFGDAGTLGMSAFWPVSLGTPTESGSRVFPYSVCEVGPNPICMVTGYYVAGVRRQPNGDSLGAVVRRNMDGGLDSTFGTNGWMSRASFHQLNDFAILNDRMYFAGTHLVSGLETFSVACVELSTGSDCPGFVSPDESFSTHGATGNAVAKRLVADKTYGLLVAGTVGTAQGYEIAVARFDPTTGALLEQFNGDGLMTSLPAWANTPAEVDVYDMALAPASMVGGARLYVAGTATRTGTDHDGFVLAWHPGTALEVSGWWPARDVFEEGDNSGNKKDAVTAITVQRNGQLAVAGWSETDVPNEHRLMLSRFNVDGSRDNRFCNGAGTCVRNDPNVGVMDNVWPVAIAERAANRDLVVALTGIGPSASDPHQRQIVWQFGSSGNLKHASQTMDYQGATPVQTSSSTAGMWIGNSGPGGNGPEVIAIVGSRRWKDIDSDMTLSQLVSNDSIYADQFGGARSD